MSAAKALKRRRIEANIERFELSDNLCRFLPPRTEFSIGVHTEWFKMPRNKPTRDQEEESPVPSPRSEREHR